MKMICAESYKLLILLLIIIVLSVIFITEKQHETQLSYYESLCYYRTLNYLQSKDSIMLTLLESEGKILNVDLIDDKEESIFYNEIKTGNKLLFYYSEINCNSCVEIFIDEIERFRKNIGYENTIYLANYKKERDMNIFKRINHVNSKIYNIDKLGNTLDSVNVPLLFFVDKEQRIRSLFIPNKENIATLKRYLAIIKTKYL